MMNTIESYNFQEEKNECNESALKDEISPSQKYEIWPFECESANDSLRTDVDNEELLELTENAFQLEIDVIESDSSLSSNSSLFADDLNESTSGMSSMQEDVVMTDGCFASKQASEKKTKSNTPSQSLSDSAIQTLSSQFVEVKDLEFARIMIPSHKELLTEQLNLHIEEDRRKSFNGWGCAYQSVTPDLLAKSGFFYLGNNDRVQCFSCSLTLKNWTENDTVKEEHKLNRPNCKMVLNKETRNIPISHKKTRKQRFPCLKPTNPIMRKLKFRMQTFERNWPSNDKPDIKLIAEAGFYFLGVGDRSKCWYCGGGVQYWKSTDDPFEEHAVAYPGCEYILQCKGLRFVKDIVAKYPNETRPKIPNCRFDHKSGKLLP